MKRSKRSSDGRYLDDPVIEDGGSVRVPMMLCDSLVGYRPGHWVRPLTDAQVAAFDARRRKPDPEDDPNEDDNDDANDVRAPARKARDAYVRQLQDAWRTPTPNRLRDCSEPDNSSSAETKRQFVRGSDDPEDAQTKRDAYQEYVASISNAWRNPPGAVPLAPASRVERIGEVTRGGK
jgi:hypothetical protein